MAAAARRDFSRAGQSVSAPLPRGVDDGDFVTALAAARSPTGVQGAQSFTLKAYRAGKATAMAAAGATVGEILQAGEWRSQAFLRYVDTDAVDEAQMLSAAVEGSDCE